MTDQQTLIVTTPTEREIVMKRYFNAPRNVVFEAWTNPKYLHRWMSACTPLSMTIYEIDLREGGIWRSVFRAQDGSEIEMRSTYLEIIRPERISWHETWSDNQPENINTIVLQEEGGATLMTFTKVFRTREERDAGIASGLADPEGGARALVNLASILDDIMREI